MMALFALALPAEAATGRVIKVLPFFVDAKGRHALSPSLYERDAYQAVLRLNPEKRSGMVFDVHWKTKGPVFSPLRLRLELRGLAKGKLPTPLELERVVQPTGRWGRWTEIPFPGEKYKDFGEVTAWRVTLWEGTQLLGKEQSFLW
jgi:hypothetical protein